MNRRVLLAGTAAASAGRVLPGPRLQLGGSWRIGPDVLMERSEVAAATAAGTIYVLGGLAEDGSTVSMVAALSPTDPAWAARAYMPEPRDHLAAVEADGLLWAVGGSPGWFNQQTSQTLWVYDALGDRWEVRTPLPLGRAAHAAAVVDGRIYVVGGIGPEAQSPLVYDVAGDRWSFIAPLSRPREHVAAAAIGGTLYLVGGRWGDVGNVALLEAYDPVADQWRPLPPMPTPRGGLAAAALNGRLWVTGGEVLDESRVTYSQLEVFDPASETWGTAPPTPTARHGLAAAVRDGELYVLAGGRLAGLDVSGVMEIYTPA